MTLCFLNLNSLDKNKAKKQNKTKSEYLREMPQNEKIAHFFEDVDQTVETLRNIAQQMKPPLSLISAIRVSLCLRSFHPLILFFFFFFSSSFLLLTAFFSGSPPPPPALSAPISPYPGSPAHRYLPPPPPPPTPPAFVKFEHLMTGCFAIFVLVCQNQTVDDVLSSTGLRFLMENLSCLSPRLKMLTVAEYHRFVSRCTGPPLRL